MASGRGVLAGLRVVELGTIGPGPFCAMMFADHGAEVVHVERPGGVPTVGPIGDRMVDLLHRNRQVIEVDLKTDEGRGRVLEMIDGADVVIEGNRPGVAERLGVGPEACLARNPRLVYGRITGWGQTGSKATRAGHDLNFLAASGTLSLLGREGQPPTVPLAFVGDLGGGAMMLAFGIMAALWERTHSGVGQVVDAGILDGSALLATGFHGFYQTGLWDQTRRGVNLVDGGCPYYDCYQTADGGYVSVGALERKFYDVLLTVLGIDPQTLPERDDRANWPVIRRRFEEVISTRTRDEWASAASGTDACLEPVLTLDEVRHEPHNAARGVLEYADGLWQPAPAPRFSRTPSVPLAEREVGSLQP